MLSSLCFNIGQQPFRFSGRAAVLMGVYWLIGVIAHASDYEIVIAVAALCAHS